MSPKGDKGLTEQQIIQKKLSFGVLKLLHTLLLTCHTKKEWPKKKKNEKIGKRSLELGDPVPQIFVKPCLLIAYIVET